MNDKTIDLQINEHTVGLSIEKICSEIGVSRFILERHLNDLIKVEKVKKVRGLYFLNDKG